uniref:Uncharacterized protein n=1 Tax=viral metagenome TaxID=1070528 RepID=A0A6C0JJ52_9ZZZZ
MSYVPPHARNNKASKAQAPIPSKGSLKPVKNNYVNDFPELGNAKPNIVTTNMNFKQLFDEENFEPTVKPKEIQKGMIILTKNGIINSLTPEEEETEKTAITNQLVHKNMIDMYIRIEQQRNSRVSQDPNYVPENVIPEYSSSEASISPDESETDAEDPEDDNEF